MTGASAVGTSSLADGQWHHVAVVRRDYKFEVWVDGEKEGEEELQKVTDKWVKKVDEVIAAKEKDILTV